jgi:hypothetical protein
MAIAAYNWRERTNDWLRMRRWKRAIWYGGLGLIVAAFALISGIVAAPLLQRIWSPAAVVAQR